MNATAATDLIYTDDDLSAAIYAADVLSEFHTQYNLGRDPYRRPHEPTTPEETARALAYEYDYNAVGTDEPGNANEQTYRRWFEAHVVEPAIAKYHRGAEILETAKVISSRRFTTGESDNAYNDMIEGETILSPVHRYPAGHIATAEAHSYTALAARKTPRR